MRFLYGAADEKFIRSQYEPKTITIRPLDTYKFKLHWYLAKPAYFDYNDVSITFKTTPDTLVNLCLGVLDAIPLPEVYDWTIADICRWLRNYGYPQYQNTFKVNLINGRTLLLLDAATLSAMNIKDFDHIRHIAYGIRSLFYYELTRFGRSISLPPEQYHELYKLFRVKSGWKYANTRRSELWRKFQLLAEKSENLSHWAQLERWLAFESEEPVYYGGARRFDLFRCKKPPVVEEPSHRHTFYCSCMPPCTCHWTAKRELRYPAVLSCLAPRLPDKEFKLDCALCMPPCTCKWTASKSITGMVLTCLLDAFPAKYGLGGRERKKKTRSHMASLRLSYWE